MKVRVSVTLDIDPESWVETYGVERSEVRADVQSWAINALAETARDAGTLRGDA